MGQPEWGHKLARFLGIKWLFDKKLRFGYITTASRGKNSHWGINQAPMALADARRVRHIFAWNH